MNSIIFISLTVFLSVLSQNGLIIGVESKSFEESIVNGEKARDGEAPFAVWVLQQQGQYSYRTCGGTLFKSNKVLTAAHCAYPGQGEVTIRFGTSDRSSPRYSDVKAAKIAQHPDFDDTYNTDDIAVITLSKNIQEDSHVKYATLQNKELELGTKVTIYGWGQTSAMSSNLPAKLLKTTLTVRRIESRKIMASSNWSLFGGGSSACLGDSGGAMVSSDGKVVGVASEVTIGCPPGARNYYTKVSNYLNWVNSQ